jgi:hypothetical protein
MVSNSKILTVSYGTFSCTLEGFDDSFDTMKAIAEYFRDLAADDRYFGAEPPSPDAEMLARIAEREISRRVEARGTDGKIHLKAGPATLPAAAQPNAQRTTQETQQQAQAATPQTDYYIQAQQPAAPADPAPAATAARQAHPASESIADKLRRIRAVATPGVSAFSASSFDEDDGEHAQDFLSDSSDFDREDDVADLPTTTDAAQPAQEQKPQEESAGADARMTDAAPAPAAQDHSDPQPSQDDRDDQDDQDDAAQMAPATVVADTPADAKPDAEVEAETTAGDADQTDAAGDHDILARLGGHINEAPAPTPDMAEDVVDDEDYDLEAMLRAAEVTRPYADPQEDEEYFEEEAVQISADDDTLSQLLADAIGSGSAARDDADQDETIAAESIEPEGAEAGEAETDETGLVQDDDVPTDVAPTAESETVQADETLADTALADDALAARVIKMKRSDLDAALAGSDLEEEMDAITSPSDLSPEAEADLRRELAEVEAELQNSHATPSDMLRPQHSNTAAADAIFTDDADSASMNWQDEDKGQEDAAQSEAQSEAPFDTLADSDDDTASRAERFFTPASDAQAARIFDEADTQLGEPESNKRRSAIQHLRAAVAATKAERRAGGAMEADVDDQPYRNDLQSAVRPRRPRPVAMGTTPRPSANPPARPAPLKLVAEQRIDTPTPPVRPRRITRADLTETPQQANSASSYGAGSDVHDDSPGFAEFAEQKGANSLTDMLEAAAAYMADVEGMPQFSRPMLMQKLREAQDEEFSREDGLRSFGQLLRQGKLQKLKGGRFAVTSVTEYRQSA